MPNPNHAVFAAYLAAVIVVGLAAARRRKSVSDDFFLASRDLPWWVIGGSLIAANISTHHFIGMSGQGYSIGLAIASYEWLAAVTLVLYGKFFLPYYLKSRITTMPEFLERRFNQQVRLAFAMISLTGYIFIELAVVLYTGALAVESIFGLPLWVGLAILCVVSSVYTIYGGLRSIAYTDVVQVVVLIAGGVAVSVLGLIKIGAVSPGYTATVWGGLRATLDGAPEKFHMVLPWNHPELPWVGVFLGGMWLANIFYWGCNQFITQRSLAARDVWHGQMGVVFAGFLKLLVPALVVLPGIIAYRLYDPESGALRGEYILAKGDLAFPALAQHLLPPGAGGLVMAGLMGAVMSSIAAMLVSSSSLLTFDIYRRLFRPQAGGAELIRVGRWAALGVLVLGTGIGYFLRDLPAIFTYIQKYWSIAYPAITAVFLAGFFYRRATAKGSLAVLAFGPAWALAFTVAEELRLAGPVPFLIRGGLDFLVCWLILLAFRATDDAAAGAALPDRSFTPQDAAILAAAPWFRSFRFWGWLLVSVVTGLYVVFY